MQFSGYWITVPLGVLAFLFIAYLLVTGRRNVRAQDEPSQAKEQDAPTESKESSSYQQIMEYQRGRLRDFVLVERCIVNYSYFSQGKLFVDFTFTVFNFSIYTVSIPMPEGAVIEGSILFKGDALSGGAKLFENKVKNCPPTGKRNFTIRQWVNSDEAKDIPSTLEKVGNLFDFSKATVYIKANEFPNDEAARLGLTRGMQRTDLENKIIQLEAELNEANEIRERLETTHETKIGKLRVRQDRLCRLNITYGMALQASDIIEFFRTTLSTDVLNRLKANIDNTLLDCFGASFRDSYFSQAPQVPDTTENLAQKFWISSHRDSLATLIELERERKDIDNIAEGQD